ncbi:MAG TPA: glycosyltransferase [Fulvivirga sp.]|nr:glycosyltransferase [Fulvivirga sp.]
MRILHVVEPFSSGIITFIIHLTRELNGHEHIVVHGSRTTEDEINSVKRRFDPNVKFVLWRSAGRNINPFQDFRALFELIKILRRKNFDVVHLHSAKAGFLGRLACKMLKIKPVIYTPNGAPFLRLDISVFKRKIFVGLEKLGNVLGGQVICCSKSESLEYLRIGIDCTYINNGTIIDKKEKIVHSKIVVGSVGIATFQKNPIQFNEIARAFEDNNNVEFIWVGGGHLVGQLNSSNVRVTGWLDTSQTEEWLKKIDIYLSCSLWEGLPFAVLEAMNTQCCLLLSNCVGNRDLVRQGDNGYLFDNSNEGVSRLTELVKDREQLENFGINSFNYCKEWFDIKNTAKQYESIYTQVSKN